MHILINWYEVKIATFLEVILQYVPTFLKFTITRMRIVTTVLLLVVKKGK